MKKLFLFAAITALAGFATEAKAESSNYYAKCTVEVAEDSKGLGTVYIYDNITETEVTELVGTGSQYGSEGATVGFIIRNYPADGYVLSNFTDQNGETYTYPAAGTHDNPEMIGVWAQSTDESNPTVYNLQAHFVKESELPKNNIASVTVTPDEKYGTFISPVSAEIPDDLKAYRIVKVNEKGLVLEKIEGGTLDPFVPVLLEFAGEMFEATMEVSYDPDDLPGELPSLTSGLLTGVLEDALVPEGSYTLQEDWNEGSIFVQADNETFIDPFRCYLTVPGSEEYSYSINTDNVEVGIATVLEDLRKSEIHDLEGRRIERLRKGVNIVGGVKVIVK